MSINNNYQDSDFAAELRRLKRKLEKQDNEINYLRRKQHKFNKSDRLVMFYVILV